MSTSTPAAGATELTPGDLVQPLLLAALLSFGAGMLCLLLLDIGDLPAVAHPGLILIVTGLAIVAVAILMRLPNIEAATLVTAVVAAVLLGLGVVFMFMALGIQLSPGDATDARESLALLIIAPVTTVVGFVLIPAVKAAQQMVTGTTVLSELWRRGGQILGVLAVIVGLVGFVGVVLGLLDWLRGDAPSQSPHTLFAGLFALLGGLLLYSLGRTMVSPVTAATRTPAAAPRA